MKDQLRDLIQKIGTGSVLFMGSGVSRRYLDLPTWEALLTKFSVCGRDFGYYRSKANGSLPVAASLLAADFHDLWWKDDQYKDSRATYKDLVNHDSDPLKIVISEYIRSNTSFGTTDEIKAELALLKSSCVDAIITTNWDELFETLFSDYRVFIGQDELLFNVPSMIAEIYKIHGCVSKFPSLVLTQEDYSNFHERNPYLASKLLNMFLEHPIIFMGYSLADENISAILESVIKCMGTNDLKRLQNRLIFVEWSADATTPTIGPGVLRLNSPSPLPITIVKTSSFLPVFESLQDHQRQIPVRILRYCKEQLYSLINSSKPEKRLYVLPFEDSSKLDRVEFVVGIGASNGLAAGKGYAMISRRDVIEDYLTAKHGYDPKMLLEHTLPIILKSSTYTPVMKCLHAAGIKTQQQLKNSGLIGGEVHYLKVKNLLYKDHLPKIKDLTFQELLKAYDEKHVLHYIPLLMDHKLDANEVLEYLKTQFHHFDNSSTRTIFCQAICACDQKLYKLE
jgi:hypothetical protein